MIQEIKKHIKKFKIKKICNNFNIKNYTINHDLTIDVEGDVLLDYKDLFEIPLNFNKVNGTFDCTSNNLTSLKGSPHTCDIFKCGHNPLRSLEDAPLNFNQILIHGCDFPLKFIKMFYSLTLPNAQIFIKNQANYNIWSVLGFDKKNTKHLINDIKNGIL